MGINLEYTCIPDECPTLLETPYYELSKSRLNKIPNFTSILVGIASTLNNTSSPNVARLNSKEVGNHSRNLEKWWSGP